MSNILEDLAVIVLNLMNPLTFPYGGQMHCGTLTSVDANSAGSGYPF